MPFTVPVAIGEAVTPIEQDAPAPRDAGQLFDWLNGAVATMLEIAAADPPALVSVTTVGPENDPTGTFPKFRSGGLSVIVAGVTPVPDSPAKSGVDGAFEAIERFAVRTPAAFGWKNAVIVQFADGASEAGQLLD